MTGYDYLHLLGTLRGINGADLKRVVDSALSVFDLAPYANVQIVHYSGGNRRKMSIAVALLGLPPIVLLDEPYAGVDVVSRSKIIEVLGRIKQKTRSLFVLNSHILDECEISCDRLSIMVDGQLKCHGGVQHLRDKYGNGYRLNFMLRHDASGDAAATAQQFSEAVPSLFPGATLTDQHEVHSPSVDPFCDEAGQLCFL
ncbi:hypothetical protein HPB48_006500 [Haemaphysalis longicornis]|uniref:ABC transporter domain-containing protein n=1 Tax=Haemaphysalis longicornis TaxID=44386 RepID=A0A9J6GID0_HAELO|nr:hypothetical protein HPB48_006500 [Haemaphysalis longicornis]